MRSAPTDRPLVVRVPRRGRAKIGRRAPRLSPERERTGARCARRLDRVAPGPVAMECERGGEMLYNVSPEAEGGGQLGRDEWMAESILTVAGVFMGYGRVSGSVAGR